MKLNKEILCFVPFMIQEKYNKISREIDERARKDGLKEKVKQRLEEEGLLK